jgi:hypothetical protein
MTKSVKKLLCEKKIEPRQRAVLPFLCDSEGILWIPGAAIRDGAEAIAQNSETDVIYIGYARHN